MHNHPSAVHKNYISLCQQRLSSVYTDETTARFSEYYSAFTLFSVTSILSGLAYLHATYHLVALPYPPCTSVMGTGLTSNGKTSLSARSLPT